MINSLLNGFKYGFIVFWAKIINFIDYFLIQCILELWIA
jgi:hypothetical protein